MDDGEAGRQVAGQESGRAGEREVRRIAAGKGSGGAGRRVAGQEGHRAGHLGP